MVTKVYIPMHVSQWVYQILSEDITLAHSLAYNLHVAIGTA